MSTRLARVRIVLSHPSHPGNIGATARAMKTMGLDQLWLVEPRSFPHPDATARASGAVDVLDAARVTSRLDDALSGTVLVAALTARRRELSAPVRDARAAAAELLDAAHHGDVAVLFGNETYGLPNEELQRAQLPVTIPANPQYASLNLAAAVQIVAYELRLAACAPSRHADAATPATWEEIEQLYAHFERAALDSGFLDPRAPRRLMARLRRLFSRTRLDREEVQILRGMLTALQRKVD